MKLYLILISAFLILPLGKLFSQDADTEKMLQTFHSISSNEIMEYVDELCADKYKGRLSGSPEYLDAAKWCAGKFAEWGIQPANNGSYFQYFPNAFSEVISLGEVVYSNGNATKTLQFPEEFLSGSNSASGTVSGEMVYVGFGITAPELGYDDYSNLDVKGKIIVLESGIPYANNDTILAKWTPYAYHRYKFQNAVKHGAAGMIYASIIANPNTVYLDNFISAHVGSGVVEQLFTDAGKDYKTVRKELAEMKTPSFAFPEKQKISISAQTKNFPDAQACNVVGLIEGSDPLLKDEVIIIGGHLDGQGSMGDVVFPGALDNASGVADILAAAKAFATSEIKPKRSILFILIGGEECGLYGSEYYAKNPLFPIEKTKLMINLDMVGNFYTQNSVHPVYYHHPLDKPNVLTPEIMEDAAKLLYVGVLGMANDGSLTL